MKIATITRAQAPAPTARKAPVNQRVVEIREMLNSLHGDQVLAFELDEGDTAKGVKTSLSRISRNMALEVDVWDNGIPFGKDGSIVYVGLAEHGQRGSVNHSEEDGTQPQRRNGRATAKAS